MTGTSSGLLAVAYTERKNSRIIDRFSTRSDNCSIFMFGGGGPIFKRTLLGDRDRSRIVGGEGRAVRAG